MASKLAIAAPCTARWEAMAVTAQGRFCAECQREVLQLSQLSAREVRRALRGGDSLCVRYQRDREGRAITRPAPWQRLWRQLALGGALLLQALVGAAGGARADEPSPQTPDSRTPPESEGGHSHHLMGKVAVTHESGEDDPYRGAGTLILKAKTAGATWSIDGQPPTAALSIDLPPGPHTIRMFAKGHQTKEVEVIVKAGVSTQLPVELCAGAH